VYVLCVLCARITFQQDVPWLVKVSLRPLVTYGSRVVSSMIESRCFAHTGQYVLPISMSFGSFGCSFSLGSDLGMLQGFVDHNPWGLHVRTWRKVVTLCICCGDIVATILTVSFLLGNTFSSSVSDLSWDCTCGMRVCFKFV
jgi:hypothetical protein